MFDIQVLLLLKLHKPHCTESIKVSKTKKTAAAPTTTLMMLTYLLTPEPQLDYTVEEEQLLQVLQAAQFVPFLLLST